VEQKLFSSSNNPGVKGLRPKGTACEVGESKSNGFKKEEIFREKVPSELKSMGRRVFHLVINRMLYMYWFTMGH
jgi:hypothetical protein